MEKILISGCLLGLDVRYDNKIQPVENKILLEWQQEKRLVVLPGGGRRALGSKTSGRNCGRIW